VKQLAQRLNIPVHQPPKLRSTGEIKRLAGLKPELIVVAAYGQILPKEALEIPPLGCLNLHPSLLPRYRGPSPVSAAILAGDSESGATIILMDEGMDTGPIIAQRRHPIDPDDTTATLTDKLSHLSANLLLEILPAWQGGEITPQPQDDGSSSYSRLLQKTEGELDWSLPSVDLWHQIRAFLPWPGSYTRLEGKTLKVLEAIPLPENTATQPGRIVELELEEAPIGVETGGGVLGIKRLQIEGKRALPASEFVRGQRNLIGRVLPD
jgi:methionyl-tRNA formyltransferase